MFFNCHFHGYFVLTGGPGWLWGGCSDNMEFGEKISRQYVDAQETGQDSRAAVNLHNNEVGRLVGFGFLTIRLILRVNWARGREQSN